MVTSLKCECFLDVILTRRSIRWFKPDPIPNDILLRIIEAGTRAPTAGGGEQWFFIIVKDAEKRKKIHKLLLEAHKKYAIEVLRSPLPSAKVEKWMKRIIEGMYLAPIYIAAYIDLRERLFNDSFLEFERVSAIQSLATAIENILLTAHSMGLGAVWLGVPLLMRNEFNKILEPPRRCELQGLIALGYPNEDVKPRARRKKVKDVIKII